MLLDQLLTCSLMHVGPLRRLLHGLDRAPCRATFSIFCPGPWSFTALLTVKIRQPSHEFTFGVGMSFIPYPLVLTPVV
jgi:hypothetical protein